LMLSWDVNYPPSSNTSTAVQRTTTDRDIDGLNGPWYEVQMKNASTGDKWNTIYRFRTSSYIKFQLFKIKFIGNKEDTGHDVKFKT